MNTTATVILIVVIVVVLAAAAVFAGRPMLRRRHLKERFGPEYDRAVEQYGDRREAERNLADRERRHSELTLKPLEPAARERYAIEWTAVQERFVDAPDDAVQEADELITRLMRDRGYPTGAHDKRMELLSVEHGHTLNHYRKAHEIARRSEAGEAQTEDLRQAMIHHRALFDDLLGQAYQPRHGGTTPTSAAPTDTPAGAHDGRTDQWQAAPGEANAPRLDVSKPDQR
ncbi:hypothetical protein OG948_20795 [Embleya sp. NBC_00888]|uniref:hypothetical protein n=1 Tax=Embleya sp. NBC_00888 TaxID=2975960 RepID=UPI00387091D3|nr:hypothetical protein OG948_20795 [Embleya sp. NBC_00888]